MALVFYALASFYAVRAVAERVRISPRATRMAAGVLLLLLAGAWQVRAVHTLEFARRRAANNHREWITDVHERREDAAGRPIYLRILDDLAPQGTSDETARQTGYPEWVFGILGPF
jgi:hypothetical protein